MSFTNTLRKMVGMKPKLSEKEKFLNKMKRLEKVPNNPSPEIESAYVGNNDKFKAYIPYFLYKPPFGYPRPSLKYMEVKKLANTPYVFGAIKAIRDRIKSMDWDIVAKDGVELTDDLKEKALHIKEWFNNPNGNYESWVDVQDMMVNDLLIYDAGVGVKVFNDKDQIQQFVARSGATFLKNPDIYGYLGNRKDIVEVDNNLVGAKIQSNDSTVANQFKLKYSEEAAYFQYGWTPGVMPVPFGKREIVYTNLNPRTDSVYGTSPVGVLREIILTLIYGSRYHLDMYINNNIPQGIIGLLGANKAQIRSFRQRLDERILQEDEFDNWRKKNYKIPVVGGKDIKDISFTPWQIPSKDMNILSQQEWFQKILWQCLGINANEMGVTQSVNKMTAENQSEILNKRALKPILMKLQYAWNNQLLPELDDTGDLMFKYNDYDIKEDHEKAELYEKKLNYMTVNEIRDLEDLEPIEGGDKLNGGGSSPFGGGFDNFNNQPQHDENSYFNKEEGVQDNEQEGKEQESDELDKRSNIEVATKSKKKKPEPASSFYGNLAGKDLEKKLKKFYSDLEKDIKDKVKVLD